MIAQKRGLGHLSRITLLALLLATSLLTACAAPGTAATTAAPTHTAAAGKAEAAAAAVVESAPSPTPAITVTYESEDLAPTSDADAATHIVLQGQSATVDGAGATADGSTVTVTAAGVYSLSGTLEDGQVIVDTRDKETVTLDLQGVSITSSTSAPLYVRRADKVVIVLAEGADNYLADAETYVYESDDDEPNATLFSKGDLTITGEGRLTVTARYLDGIASKDGLKITGGVITVGAKDDGIRGRDYVAISGGEISVRADGDGIKATNDEDPDRGFVLIEGGRIDVIAGADGIQAETTLAVQGGDITLSTGGGSANASPQASQAAGPGRWPAGQAAASEDSGDSAKGLKAGVSLSIAAGTITIDSADDAVHSNDSVAISGGSLTLASGDDGIHADASLTISGGLVRITTSYEGIESAMITISGGEMHVTARDDGLNVAGGVDGSAVNGRPGQNVFADTADRRLEISGGTIVVDANGDGIDVNGAIIMTGGVVLISGPTASMNGALDYDRGFQITGGLLVAAGSAGMAQAPDRTSTQHAVLLGFSTVQQAGSIVHIADSAGGDILTFAPAKDYQTIAFSSPDLAQGASYTVYTGGQSSGEAVDGLYSDGVYTPGSEALTFTVSDIITAAGANLGGMRGGAPGGGGRPGR